MGSLAGMIGGLVGSGQKLPTVDMQALLDTINSSGENQRALINQLPAEVQAQLAQYQNANTQNGMTYQKNITDLGNNYLDSVKGIYGPDSAAAQAENNANRQQIYSTVPGTQDAIRAAMASSGGLGRGNAGVALAQPYVQAAQQYGQAAANTNAKQTAQGQNAQMQALQVVNQMNDAMFTNLFGMSKAQATQILQSGNQALSTQLADLLTQSNNEANQKLAVQGIQANNGYQNAVTRNAQQGAIWNGLIDTGLQDAGVMDGSGGMNSPFGGDTSIWKAFGNIGQIFGGAGNSGAAADGGAGVAGAIGGSGTGEAGAGSMLAALA